MLVNIRLIKNKGSNLPKYAVFQIFRVQNIFFFKLEFMKSYDI